MTQDIDLYRYNIALRRADEALEKVRNALVEHFFLDPDTLREASEKMASDAADRADFERDSQRDAAAERAKEAA